MAILNTWNDIFGKKYYPEEYKQTDKNKPKVKSHPITGEVLE